MIFRKDCIDGDKLSGYVAFSLYSTLLYLVRKTLIKSSFPIKLINATHAFMCLWLHNL